MATETKLRQAREEKAKVKVKNRNAETERTDNLNVVCCSNQVFVSKILSTFRWMQFGEKKKKKERKERSSISSWHSERHKRCPNQLSWFDASRWSFWRLFLFESESERQVQGLKMSGQIEKSYSLQVQVQTVSQIPLSFIRISRRVSVMFVCDDCVISAYLNVSKKKKETSRRMWEKKTFHVKRRKKAGSKVWGSRLMHCSRKGVTPAVVVAVCQDPAAAGEQNCCSIWEEKHEESLESVAAR